MVTILEHNFISVSHENKEILIFKNIEQLSDFAIEKWMGISERAIKDRGYFTVALSGGKTPMTLYQKLANLKNSLPWDKTHIFLVDERFVPYEDKESNYNMINQTLLRHVKIPKENVHPISTKEDTPQTSAAEYEEDLIAYFKLGIESYRPAQGEFPKFDLILLGIGEDGHTASLFPDSPSLKENKHLTIAITPSDTSKKERITLTFSVINNADNIIFLASGSNKAKTVKEVIEEGNNLLPAAMVRPKNGKLFFLMDESAGLHLSLKSNN